MFLKKGGRKMATILPVSDLRNYNTVLEHVSVGTPVYLTVNGRGRYIIKDIADEEETEKLKALLQLMHEIEIGRKSADEEGVVPLEEVRAYIKKKIDEM